MSTVTANSRLIGTWLTYCKDDDVLSSSSNLLCIDIRQCIVIIQRTNSNLHCINKTIKPCLGAPLLIQSIHQTLTQPHLQESRKKATITNNKGW